MFGCSLSQLKVHRTRLIHDSIIKSLSLNTIQRVLKVLHYDFSYPKPQSVRFQVWNWWRILWSYSRCRSNRSTFLSTRSAHFTLLILDVLTLLISYIYYNVRYGPCINHDSCHRSLSLYLLPFLTSDEMDMGTSSIVIGVVGLIP